MSVEPHLGWDERRVAYSGSYGCSLVKAIACRACHGSGMAGGMVEAVFACCQLLPLLMLQLSILLVSISLSPTPVLTVELLMVQQSRGDPTHQALVQREEVRRVVGSSSSTNTKWPRDAFAHVKVTTDECQMPGNSRIEQYQEQGVIMLKSVDYKVFTKPSKTNMTKKKVSCHRQ